MLNPQSTNGGIFEDLALGESAVRLADLRDEPYMPRRGGKKLDKSAVFRWAKSGVNGHRLETIRTPTGLVTTRPAVMRFFANISEKRVSTSRTSRARQRQAQQASHELANEGI